jgi:hypothetical protein
MTRDELLEKGVSADVADEIIAAFDEKGSENSLELLEKALAQDDKQESLFKAEEEEEEEEEGEKEYDEEYMRKYMKKYMKANMSACKKAAKELGMFSEDMKKAIDDVNIDAEGAVVEMTDLAPFLESQREFNEQMAKAVSTLANEISVIAAQTENGFDVMHKAARVQLEQARAFDEFMATPSGRKGVTATANMQKAVEYTVTPEQKREVYSALFKATRSGDHKAGEIISIYESSGQNLHVLTPEQKLYVNDLLNKEVQ